MSSVQARRDHLWTLFPGSVGGEYVASNATSMTCLSRNLTLQGPCDTANPANW
jgi:hypothetical protein